MALNPADDGYFLDGEDEALIDEKGLPDEFGCDDDAKSYEYEDSEDHDDDDDGGVCGGCEDDEEEEDNNDDDDGEEDTVEEDANCDVDRPTKFLRPDDGHGKGQGKGAKGKGNGRGCKAKGKGKDSKARDDSRMAPKMRSVIKTAGGT